jgi:pyrimidine deaminase RibD-like protein
MTLADVSRSGEVAVLRYLLGPGGTDRRFLRAACELARRCLPSDSAFSVGAIIVSAEGEILSTGYSREQQDHDHAEEVALRKLAERTLGEGKPAPDPRLRHATIYSSLVPCGARASRPVTCVQHIIAVGIPRVVFAWREPRIFTDGQGAEQLLAAGVTVIEIPDLAAAARSANAHLLPEHKVVLAPRSGPPIAGLNLGAIAIMNRVPRTNPEISAWPVRH